MLISTAGLWSCLSAQSYVDFSPLRSAGPIPADFLESASLKYEREMNHWADSSKEMRSAVGTYYEEDFYYLNRLLQSGQVLFGDPLSQYVSQVADHILRDQAELRQQLRFYIVRSTVANASSTNDGIVLVNMGLLARVENEAQLAFVLCHEISHFVERHALKGFQQYIKQENDTKGLRKAKNYEILQEAHSLYSQEVEKEADRLGMALYLKADYPQSELSRVFDILKVADHDFGQEALDRSLLESDYLTFNQAQWPDTLEYVYDASLSAITHPQPLERKNALLENLEAYSPSDKTLIYWVGKKAFREARESSRFELCQRYQLERSYESAFYAASVLLKTQKHQQYLYKQLTYSLYAIAQFSHVGEFWDVHQDYEELAGPSHRLAYLMEQLNPPERTVLALSFAWKAQQRYPQDAELIKINQDLMQSLGRYYVDSLAYFYGLDQLEGKSDTSFVRTGLADLLADEAFRAAMKTNLQIGLNLRRAFKAPNSQTLGESQQKKIAGFTLDLDSLVLINPRFQSVDRRENPETQLKASAEGGAHYKASLQRHAKTLDLDLQLLAYDSLQVGDVDKLNDIQLFQEWLFEIPTNQGLQRISILQDEVAGLAERYGTSYFAWSQVVVVSDVRPGRKMMLWMGLFPPILPYSLYYVLTPTHKLYFYTTIYDIKRGKYLLVYPQQLRMKDRKDVINSVAYDLILQITSE
ncbi:MAG: M48 family metallopeptidase [Bacteroidia bacterium]